MASRRIWLSCHVLNRMLGECGGVGPLLFYLFPLLISLSVSRTKRRLGKEVGMVFSVIGRTCRMLVLGLCMQYRSNGIMLACRAVIRAHRNTRRQVLSCEKDC